MKYGVFAVLCLALVACQGNTQEKISLKTAKDSVSYSIGLDIGRNLKRQSVEVESATLAAGIKAIMDSTTPMLTEAQVKSVMESYQARLMEKHAAVQKAAGDKNIAEGKKFLEENGKKEGVVTLPDGLQYKIIKTGTGKKPSATSTVSVNYRGTLIDGTEFDSSQKHGQAAEFPLNGVVKGWTEALQLMPVGSKWMLYLPSDLGWGEHGNGAEIGPNAVTIFEVELLAIK